MGGRVKDKEKKKSIKAKVTSKFSAKRKLSRMGKRQKKGHAGINAEFITRSAAIRRLQITLKDFRRLCILKGIYPRVPSKAPAGKDKIYYDIKDIAYIMHEPLLEKFREFKAFMKKIRRAAGRNQFQDARKKNDLKPKMTLDHLVKERYPRFIDALRDMDDALCMVHLFAALPSVGRITAERTANCAKLAREWHYYVAKSRSLKKVFVSVKGIYYQAEIMGEPITWLVPHQFTQTLPKEVDYRVMLTFLEFYEVFLKFALYKLYHMQDLHYPPVVDKSLEAEGSCLLAMKSEVVAAAKAAVENTSSKDTSTIEDPSLAAKLLSLTDKLKEVEEDDDEDDDEEIGAPLQAAFSDLQNIGSKDNELEEKTFGEKLDSRQSIFSKLTFFINREVPLEWLQFCITAFGGRVGWEGPHSPFSLDDPRITHHVIDRPLVSRKIETRDYVQPQWIFDSINAQLLLPIHLYSPGAKLPPHLSPFVDDEKEGYMPRFREEIKKLQEDAGIIPKNSITPATQQKNDDEDVEDESQADSIDENTSQDEEIEEIEEVATNKGPKAIVYNAQPAFKDEASEQKELARNMMSKKTKRLYDRMQHGIKEKKGDVQKLEAKRKSAEVSADSSHSSKKSRKEK